LIHAHGSLAPVRFDVVANNLGLTGLFSSGAQYGLMRLSLAGDPASGVSPGFGLKLFVDGQISANLIGMFSLDGQGADYNYFRHQLKTRVRKPTGTSFFNSLGLDAGQLLFQTGADPATSLASDQVRATAF
jgi:hypothetical protein